MHEKKKPFSVIPKALPWHPNHVTICLLRHSGESLQNGQLKLRRRNWYFARETHKDAAVSVWTCQAGFWKSTEHRVSFEANPMRVCKIAHWSACYINGRDVAQQESSFELYKLNPLFRLTAGRLHGSSCIVIPGVVCKLLQFAAKQ